MPKAREAVMEPGVIVGGFALAAAVVSGLLSFRSTKGTNKITNDANLRDDQLAFIKELKGSITELKEENMKGRETRNKLDLEIERLHEEIDRLRFMLEQTRTELAEERQARRAGDAGLQAEHQSRSAGSTEIQARQAGDQARQDVHDEPGFTLAKPEPT